MLVNELKNLAYFDFQRVKVGQAFRINERKQKKFIDNNFWLKVVNKLQLIHSY